MKRPRAANRIAIIPPPVAMRAMCHHKRYTPPVLGASVVEISSVVVQMGSFVVTSSSTQVNLILQRDQRVSLVWVSQKHLSFIGNLQWRVGCQQRFCDQRFMCHSHRTFVELHVPPVNNFSSAIDNDKIVIIVRYLIKIFILKLVVENFTWLMKILEWCLSIWQIFSSTFVLTNFFKKLQISILNITNTKCEHQINQEMLPAIPYLQVADEWTLLLPDWNERNPMVSLQDWIPLRGRRFHDERSHSDFYRRNFNDGSS